MTEKPETDDEITIAIAKLLPDDDPHRRLRITAFMCAAAGVGLGLTDDQILNVLLNHINLCRDVRKETDN
jgi:hypothetical protein